LVSASGINAKKKRKIEFRRDRREAVFPFPEIEEVKIKEPGVRELWRPAGLSLSIADTGRG
jgi:hypothetical protein